MDHAHDSRTAEDPPQASTPQAKAARLKRWQRRGESTCKSASARYAWASSLLLRALLNFHRERHALFPREGFELAHLWEASDELFGGRPPRGIRLGCEATEIARTLQPQLETPDASYPLLTLQEIKSAWCLARALSSAAKIVEAGRPQLATTTRATGKFYRVMGGIASGAPAGLGLAA